MYCKPNTSLGSHSTIVLYFMLMTRIRLVDIWYCDSGDTRKREPFGWYQLFSIMCSPIYLSLISL